MTKEKQDILNILDRVVVALDIWSNLDYLQADIELLNDVEGLVAKLEKKWS